MFPTRKVTAAGAVGAVTTILVWILASIGVAVPAEVSAAITTAVMFAVAYFVPELIDGVDTENTK